ncbi:transglutaminase-like cysteine peptidase [Myxococcota bacterium]|nr:transglutaminase-like cysteine peptidase [Myxococcota bacterium]
MVSLRALFSKTSDEQIEATIAELETAALAGKLEASVVLSFFRAWLAADREVAVTSALERLLTNGYRAPKFLQFGIGHHLGRRDYEGAYRFAEAVAYGDAPDADALVQLAQVATLRGSYRLALGWCGEHLLAHPGDPKAMRLVAECHLRLGQLRDALVAMRESGRDDEPVAQWLAEVVERGRRVRRANWIGSRGKPDRRLVAMDWKRRVIKADLGVKTRTWSEIDAFINACSYVSDDRLFGTSEYWQPPHDFEARRMGDCEDFALWTWVQLLRQGVNARFVLGALAGWEANHAWVQIYKPRRVLVAECTPQGLNVPIEASTAREYQPMMSIDRTLVWYSH